MPYSVVYAFMRKDKRTDLRMADRYRTGFVPNEIIFVLRFQRKHCLKEFLQVNAYSAVRDNFTV